MTAALSPTYLEKLMEERIVASTVGITKFLKRYRETGTIAQQILPRFKVATKALPRVNVGRHTIYGVCSTSATAFAVL